MTLLTQEICSQIESSIEPYIISDGGKAHLRVGERSFVFNGKWVTGTPWDRFGLYNCYVVVRHDGAVVFIPAHAGEIAPGSTEDLVVALRGCCSDFKRPLAPMTLELDPTYSCNSKDCGGRCFSTEYRKLAPHASVPTQVLKNIICDFSEAGGRIVRFDGGGDPLMHPAVRDGELSELAYQLSLKSTILTSGDLIAHSDLQRIGRANCYVRISLNAATDKTRQLFHGNQVSIRKIFSTIEHFADWLESENPTLPIGATFLLDTLNYHEVLNCSRKARDSGISHFSVRRVIGSEYLRPNFSAEQKAEIDELLARVCELATEKFRVFIPWRDLNEPDLNPAGGDFNAVSCWQSTFKTIIEPDPSKGGFRAQLCGRYRGGGLGQRQQMPPLLSSFDGVGWTEKWRRSFDDYSLSREVLPSTCVSCIDRGFILMIDRLLSFLGDPGKDFYIFHLQSIDHAPNQDCCNGSILSP